MADGVVVPLAPRVEGAARRKRRSRRGKERLRLAALATLGLALGVPPLLFNGAFGWATVATAARALAALGAALASATPGDREGTPLGLAVFGALALTALQATPLPASLVRALRPDVYDTAARSAVALGEAAPRMLPLTLDPGATRERLLAALAVTAAFFAAALVARRSRTHVLELAALSVALVVAVTLGHLIADVHAVYGVYEPTYASSMLPSPLINPNHLGGFCAFGVLLALGLAIAAEHPAARFGFVLLAFSAAALTFASLSRGAIGALAVGCAGFALAFAARTRRREARTRRRALVAFAGLVAVLAALAWVGMDTVFAELTRHDLHKLEVSRAATRLLGAHPLLGVGRGAFSSAFAPVMGTSQRYVHPENLLLQWATEWGLPFATLLFLAVIATLARILGRTRSSARLAGVFALLTIGLQNLFDFGLEMSGEAIVVAAVAGASVCERAGVASARRPLLRDGILGGATLVAGALLLPVLGPSVARGGVIEVTGRIEAALERGDDDAVRAIVADAVALHPREPNFPLLAGASATRRGDASALRWLNLAMTLAPQWSSPHEVAARWLAAHGHLDQALLELRAAEERRPGSGIPFACRIFGALPRPELVARAAPTDGHRRARFENALSACLPRDSAVAAALDAALLERAPELAAPRVRSARRALAAGDPARALALLEPSAAHHEGDLDFVLAHAAALSAAGRGAEAVARLERAHAEGSGRRRLLEALVRAHAQLGHAEDVAHALAMLRGLAGGSSAALARASLLEGAAEERMGHPAAAIRAYREADRYDPTCGALTSAARVVRRSGGATQLYQIYSTLCRREGPSSPACEELRRVESAARRTAVLPSPSRGALP